MKSLRFFFEKPDSPPVSWKTRLELHPTDLLSIRCFFLTQRFDTDIDYALKIVAVYLNTLHDTLKTRLYDIANGQNVC
jgi:hypothetical protein